jgi:hypothetical protein
MNSAALWRGGNNSLKELAPARCVNTIFTPIEETRGSILESCFYAAGKGFAVVASEVKSPANQTAKATEDISAAYSA